MGSCVSRGEKRTNIPPAKIAAEGTVPKTAKVRDARHLRLNSRSVLLTRGRDACVVFVPPLPESDEIYGYLERAGFKVL